MGRYASGSAPEMIDQARALHTLQLPIDRAYLDARIRAESMGDYGVEDLES